MKKTNAKNRIPAAIIVAILAFVLFYMPAYAATNGTGDFSDGVSPLWKAWVNIGGSAGPLQDESGYYIEVYCCDVLGSSGPHFNGLTRDKFLFVINKYTFKNLLLL